MKVFKDDDGKEWRIALTVASADNVLEHTGVDLLHLDEPRKDAPHKDIPVGMELQQDLRLMGRVVYYLLHKEDRSKLELIEFEELLGGDAIVNAMNALWEEVVNFFRRLGRHKEVTMVEEMMKALNAIDEKGSAVYRKEAAKAVDRIDAVIEEKFGNGQASSESTRDPILPPK